MKKSTKRMIKKIKNLNYKRMYRIIEIISKENNKPKIYILLDMIKNFITRGISYTDYFRGNYINLTKKEKKTYVTTKSFYKIIHYFNKEDYTCIFYDKLLFNRIFKEYLKRDYIDITRCSKEEYCKFLDNHNVVFAKNPLGEGGQGIRKIISNQIEDKEKLYEELLSNKQILIEEEIIQSDELNEINPHAVNSFRVVTLLKDGKPYIVGNALRINQFENEIIGYYDDIYFSLNEEGRLSSNAIDDYGKIYNFQPLTKKKFSEVKISKVKEAFDICKKAALEIPQVRYVGWDIAFSNKGPIIVEGNDYPGYGVLQYYKLNNKREGHLKDIENIIGDEIKNIKM